MSLPKEQHSQESLRIGLHLDGYLETSGCMPEAEGARIISNLSGKRTDLTAFAVFSFALRMLRAGHPLSLYGEMHNIWY